MSFSDYSKETRFRIVFLGLAVVSAAAFWLLVKSGITHGGRTSYVLFLPPAALLFFTTVFHDRIRQGHTV